MLYQRPSATGARTVTFEYKCVAGPMIVEVRSSRARDQAVKAFEEIINREAAHDWEFIGIDEFHVSEPQGFFNRKRVYVPSKILVFRREKPAPAPAVAQPPAAVAAPGPAALSTPPAAPAVPSAEAPSIKAIADSLKAGKTDRA
jgi:hypothetical protein